MHGEDLVFKEFLIDAGLVSRGQLEQLAGVQSKSLSRALIDSGVLGEEEVRRASAHALGVPFIILDPHDISQEAMLMIPEPLARAHNIFAYNLADGGVEVVLLDLADLAALEPLQALGAFGGQKVLPRLTTRESLTRALVKYQQHLKEKFGELLTSGMHVAEALIKHALYSRAGGVHVDITTMGALVRYQIGHALHEAMRLPEQAGKELAAQLKSLAKILPVSRPQEGKFKIQKDDDAIGVHLSMTPTVGGERLSMRLSHGAHGARGHTLESLGVHGEAFDALHAMLAKQKGLAVVSGPEGSGKTTLLYTLLDLLARPGIAISTVEEKVEYRLPHAAQVEVGGGVSVGTALRAALKQSPDVLMIGNIKDTEGAALAASAAQRGALVLAGAQDESLLPQADVVVRLALVRRLCTKEFGHAKTLSRAELDALEPYADFAKVFAALKDEKIIPPDMAWKDIDFARAAGCSECQSGYKGWVGLQQVEAPGYDCLNIIEDGLFKSAQGLTSLEEFLGLVS